MVRVLVLLCQLWLLMLLGWPIVVGGGLLLVGCNREALFGEQISAR